MIETIWVENPTGDVLELNLRSSSQEHGLLIFNLEGLGPPVATVNGSGGPSFDGVRQVSVSIDARHLSMTLAVSGFGVLEEEAKDKIYRFFPIKQEILFGVKTDRKEVYIPAFVEQNEFNQFAKVENAVLSLYCPAPYFLDTYEQVVSLSGDSSIPLFTFPFENDSFTVKELEFGYLVDSPTANVEYSGDVKTGIDIIIDITGATVGDVIITNTNGQQTMTLNFTDVIDFFGSPLALGDQIVINTRMGEKSIYYIRGTVSFNMINGVAIDSDWIDIRPGTNIIVITAFMGIEYLETELKFRPLSEGV